MNQKKKIYRFIIFLLGITLGGWSYSFAGSSFKDFSVQTPNGTYTLSKNQGKTRILFFSFPG